MPAPCECVTWAALQGAFITQATPALDAWLCRSKCHACGLRHREGLQRRQEKEMRKYTRVPARSSAAAGGLSAAYLEAADEDVEEEEDDYGGLTASERARQSLARPRRDARDEVQQRRMVHCVTFMYCRTRPHRPCCA
jgi:hypothetical protein